MTPRRNKVQCCGDDGEREGCGAGGGEEGQWGKDMSLVERFGNIIGVMRLKKKRLICNCPCLIKRWFDFVDWLIPPIHIDEI